MFLKHVSVMFDTSVSFNKDRYLGPISRDSDFIGLEWDILNFH